MAKLFLLQNGPKPTTAGPVKVTTGTSIKTMLQLLLPVGIQGKVVEWGISFDGSAAATPIECELVETGAVAATVTAFVTADITRFGANDIDPLTALMTASTSGSGYTSTSEGSVTATRELDFQQVAPTNQYVKQFPLGREPEFGNGNVLRVRVTAGAAVNAYCYVIVEI